MAEDLFGNTAPESAGDKAKRTRRITNDMNTIMRVLTQALSDESFVLIGPTGHVHRRQGETGVKQSIWREAEVVHQLITAGTLKLGGHHQYTVGNTTKTGQSVLVPKATRDMVSRWKALKPMSTSNTGRKSA